MLKIDPKKKKKITQAVARILVVYVWIPLKIILLYVLVFFCGSRALFTRLTSMDFSKNNFKTGSHGIIRTFKNYFTTMFSIFNNKRCPNRPLVYMPHVTTKST